MKRGALFQVLHTGAGMLFLQIIAFFTTALIARGLGPLALGKYQLVISISIFSTMLAALGLDEAVAYFLPQYQVEHPEKVRGLVFYTLGVTGVIGVILGITFRLGATKIETMLKIPGISADLGFALWLLPAFMMLSMSLAILRGLHRSDWRAYIYYYLVGSLFFGGILLCRAAGLTSSEAYTARILSLAVGAIVACGLIYFTIKGGRQFPEYAELRRIHTFGGVMIFAGMFQYLVEQPLLDLIVVARYASPEAVGLYSVAAKVAAVIAMVAVTLNVVMAPMFARSVALKDAASLHQQYRQASIWMAVSALVAGIAVLLLQRQVLLFFGVDFLAARSILRVLVTGQVIVSLLGANAPLLIASGFVRLDVYLCVAACVLMLTLWFFLAQSFGALGVAAATAISTATLAGARRVAVERKIFSLLGAERLSSV